MADESLNDNVPVYHYDAPTPNDWKQAHAEAADRTVTHPLVERVMAELRDNLGVSDTGLPAYGIAKVAHYAAQVARAQALGFDPELLRLSDDEAHSEQMRLAAEATLLGIPVHLHNDPMSDEVSATWHPNTGPDDPNCRICHGPVGVDLIAAERQRQIDVEGYTAEHDADHVIALARAAVAYATPSERRGVHRDGAPLIWPWEPTYWKPTPDDRVRELVKAGALAAAAIDALLAVADAPAAPEGDPKAGAL